MTSNESEESPEGMSTARRNPGALFMSSMARAYNPSAGFCNPVPNTASTMIEAWARVMACFFQHSSVDASTTSTPDFSAAARFSAASPFSSDLEASRRTVGSAPRSRRCLAATSPSPPLLPLPATTTMPRRTKSGKRAAISAAIRHPAFSINATPGMPISSIVVRSIVRICSAVRIFMVSPRRILS